MNNRIYYENAFVLFLDKALNELTSNEFSELIKILREILYQYEEDET